jgi:hypothetical protein
VKTVEVPEQSVDTKILNFDKTMTNVRNI